MLFPPRQRVIYRENPLVEVVCQLRFPAVLRIDAEIPVEFQEAVRLEFPSYVPTVEHAHNVELREFDGQSNARVSHVASTNHAFISADKKWRINLTSGFIALSTLNYQRWEEFRDRLIGPLYALMDIYEPASFDRIGLRYTDAIDRVDLGFESCGWAELVRPELLGMLATEDIPEDEVRQSSQVSELRLDDTRTMVVNTGIGGAEGHNNPCFIIDTDTFDTTPHEPTVAAALEVLDGLHAPVSSFFQWAIQPQLSDRLGPDTDSFKEG